MAGDSLSVALARVGRTFSTEPLYNPKTFNSHKILTATSFAALSYIGFDGILNLRRMSENPKRNVLLAAVLTCIFVVGMQSALEVYLARTCLARLRSFPNL